MSDLSVAIKAAQIAGFFINKQYARVQSAEIKSNFEGLVTRVDRECEQILFEKLTEHTPYRFVGEEHGSRGESSEKYWCVDPIDGTSNFFRKLPVFAVSIALVKGDQVLLGVIHDPVQEKTWYSEKGRGAFVNGKPVAVSHNREHAKSIIFINHGYSRHDRLRTAALTKRLGLDFTIRMLGSTAVELCYVANGQADAFICCGDALWDYAAGIVLVEEAGGKVSDWTGGPVDFNKSFVFASSGNFHGDILEEIEDLQSSEFC
ncbi:inositol monophosphatase [candidate division KSB1 bacterium]|nr:inositol monophosphatase [candidate division KSB1 bacterium]